MTGIDDIEEAAVEFQNIFKTILDKHAPMKTFQIRKHYIPYLSEETKLLMEERDALKQEATYHQDGVLLYEYKKKRNEFKESVEADRKKYIRGDVQKKPSIFTDIVQIGGGEVNPISKYWKEMIFWQKLEMEGVTKHIVRNGSTQSGLTNPQPLVEMFFLFHEGFLYAYNPFKGTLYLSVCTPDPQKVIGIIENVSFKA